MLGKFKIIHQNSLKRLVVPSPIEGAVVPVSKVNDPAFREELIGKGVAIKPSKGRVVAPFNGKITQVFGTGHAIRMVSDKNVEILIHIGIDTIELKGKYFNVHFKVGDKVRRGNVLIEFENESIAAAGYDLISPVIICNSDNCATIEPIFAANVKELEPLIRLKKIQ